MLQPNDIDAKSGKCVLDILREKYPPPGVANHDVFLTCSELPLIFDSILLKYRKLELISLLC